MKEGTRVVIHCPNPEKFPRFAAGFQGKTGKFLGFTKNQDFFRIQLASADNEGVIVIIDPFWVRRAA